VIDVSQYCFILPQFYLDKARLAESDVVVYRRKSVREQIEFLRNRVIDKNVKGNIVGPPGTGKSICTFAFMLSLDREVWQVIWFHLAKINYCLTLGPNSLSVGIDANYELPRKDQKRLFICVDGFKEEASHKDFYNKLGGQIRKEDRIVTCSSMATLGKSNAVDDKLERFETFHVPSWTKEEYLSAIANETFYQKVKGNLDAHEMLLSEMMDVHEVDGEDKGDRNTNLSEEKEQALIWKFYYAGGSCRYMFQFTTDFVIEQLGKALKSVKMKHNEDEINRLYGMTSSGARVAMSSYVTRMFARESDSVKIATLIKHLNAQENPSIDGFILEWLFFASVQKCSLELFDMKNTKVTLPRAEVIMFDPKRKFKILQEQDTFTVAKSDFWLQPVDWNQGGYDAVYIDSKENVVIFAQLTISHQHSLKLRFFHAVLQNLHATTDKTKTISQEKLTKWKVEIYLIVKESNLSKFKISEVDDKMLLSQFDPKWAGQEEKQVKIFAISGRNNFIEAA